MRILPRSLFGRLSLVLLTGLVAAQLLSAALLLRNRGEVLYQTLRGDLVERTAGIVRLFDALDAGERRRLLPLFNTRELRIRLAGSALDRGGDSSDRGEAVGLIEQALQERLPAGSQVRVSLEGLIEQASGVSGMERMRRRHMGYMGGMVRPWDPLHGLDVRTRRFVIEVRLSDGSWMLFDRRLPEGPFRQPTRLLLILAILLVSVILLSLLAVRWLVSPLRRLRTAAEELGRDIHRPPLEESGPLEVASTARAFNTMQQRIQSFVDDRSRILAAVSHDLKTPLTRLRLRTDLLDDEELRDRIQADLGDMESMVTATLDFMRGTESREATQKLDLMALLETIQEEAAEAGWKVNLESGPIEPLQARPALLKRCIANLVENAARYGGAAEIAVRAEAGLVRVLVCDRGPGVPAEFLERVFEPFFRIEASRARHTGGTGLGLGIARNIARAHGGELVLRNRAGGGLCAELSLPQGSDDSAR